MILNQWLLAIVLTTSGATPIQTLGPFNDRDTCREVAEQMAPLKIKHVCIKLPAPPQPKQ